MLVLLFRKLDLLKSVLVSFTLKICIWLYRRTLIVFSYALRLCIVNYAFADISCRNDCL